MITTMLGVKKGMTSSYDARGRRVGATVIEVGPNFITQLKTSEGKEGYNAAQLGFSTKKSVRKPQLGLFKKIGVEQNLRWLREQRVDDVSTLEAGKEIKVGDVFKIGDAVKITGTSKGKGFQGGVRRHGFAGGPKTHGQSDRHRAPGSIGAGTTPGRVYKGKRMAGHMGVDTVSYTGLEVLAIDRANNLLTIKGGVPGPIGALVMVQKQGVIKGYTPPPEEKPDEEEEQQAEKSSEENPEQPAESAATQTEVAEKASPVDSEKEKGEENAS